MYRFCENSALKFITFHKSIIIIFMFILFLITRNVDAQMLNDYPEVIIPEPEMIHNPSGTFIKLKCKLNICHNKNNTFKWELKACGPDLQNKPDCSNSGANEWEIVPENNKFEQCDSTYIIAKASSNHSGLYRCSVILPHSKETKVIKIYQLHVIDRINEKTSGIKPKLVDIVPVNVTKEENLKIVIQCKIYCPSISPPEIWWLKQLDFPVFNKKTSITFNNKTYLNLKTSQIKLDNSTYISKLIIEKSNEKDSGVYTCLAMNYFGNSTRDVNVHVISLRSESQGSASFLILFLIPLSFALIPLSVWLFVHYYRKKKMRKFNAENVITTEAYKYRPVINRYNFNTQNRTPNASHIII